jgi:protein TonB
VQAHNLINKVIPIYPPDAKRNGIEGTVRFQAINGRDGHVLSLQVVSGDSRLVDAARDAVMQWVYKPTLLNGEPVEVVTTIDVNFILNASRPPHM